MVVEEVSLVEGQRHGRGVAARSQQAEGPGERKAVSFQDL